MHTKGAQSNNHRPQTHRQDNKRKSAKNLSARAAIRCGIGNELSVGPHGFIEGASWAERAARLKGMVNADLNKLGESIERLLLARARETAVTSWSRE